MRAIPERLTDVITTRHYTNPRLPYLTLLKLPTLVAMKEVANGITREWQRRRRQLFSVKSKSVICM